MELLILWAGFAGAWLLFAGPVYQASVELREEEIDHDAIESAARSVDKPKPVSAWWWFIPPVAYILTQRNQRLYRDAALERLDAEQREQFVGFTQKARGWLIVALGAFFIAVKETWELAEGYHWQTWWFWVLVVVMPLGSLVFTVRSMLAAERKMGHERPAAEHNLKKRFDSDV